MSSFPKDKLLHYTVGTLVCSVSYLVIGYYSMLLVVAVGIGKEVYDYKHKDKHTPDVYDALATILGGLVAMLPTVKGLL